MSGRYLLLSQVSEAGRLCLSGRGRLYCLLYNGVVQKRISIGLSTRVSLSILRLYSFYKFFGGKVRFLQRGILIWKLSGRIGKRTAICLMEVSVEQNVSDDTGKYSAGFCSWDR